MKRALRIMLLLSLAATAMVFAHADDFVDGSFFATVDNAKVTVEQGELLGFVENGIYTYHGVPYAKAARFKAPEPPEAWSGLRLAMNYGEVCPVPKMDTVATDEQFNPHRYFPENENCQYLNIWTPGLDDAKRPVAIYIHGGGFTNGSSVENVSYEGGNLAKLGNLVVVTLNHRLNVLGSLDLSEYGHGYVSNPGMRDIKAALEWVNANIAAFGGDPDNVTIMGQSGGAGKVNFLMACPSAAPLFKRAVMMTGVSSAPAKSGEMSQAIARHLVENLGLTKETIQDIETVPYAELLAAGELALQQTTEELGTRAGWGPTVDGDFMPLSPNPDGWAIYAADKPLLIGNVLQEHKTVTSYDAGTLLADNWNAWSSEQTTEKLKEMFGDKTDALIAAWQEAYPRKKIAELAVFDPKRRQGSFDMASLKTETGTAAVYSYVFAWHSPVLDGVAGTWHVSDVPMAFYSVDLIPQAFGGGEDARSMAFDVSRAFINFIRTGDPNHSGLPDWPAFTPQNGAVMIFDDYSVVGNFHDKKVLDLMNGK